MNDQNFDALLTDALNNWPLVPAPRTLLPAVRREMTPSPRFRLDVADVAVPLTLSLTAVTSLVILAGLLGVDWAMLREAGESLFKLATTFDLPAFATISVTGWLVIAFSLVAAEMAALLVGYAGLNASYR